MLAACIPGILCLCEWLWLSCVNVRMEHRPKPKEVATNHACHKHIRFRPIKKATNFLHIRFSLHMWIVYFIVFCIVYICESILPATNSHNLITTLSVRRYSFSFYCKKKTVATTERNRREWICDTFVSNGTNSEEYAIQQKARKCSRVFRMCYVILRKDFDYWKA